MTENGASPHGLTAIARLKRLAEQRNEELPLEIGGETFSFRRLNGVQADRLVKLQVDEPNISTARYAAEVVAMTFVSDTGTALTAQEVLEIGPWFYKPASDFVFAITNDYLDQAAAKAAQPGPVSLAMVRGKRSSRRGVR